jgi:hypothetical protein
VNPGLPPLTHVRDLEEFEGPILSELAGEDGSVWLEKWCACHNGEPRTLVVKSSRHSVDEYLDGRASMLDLLTIPNKNSGFLVDSSRHGLVVCEVWVSELPESYLPKPSAMHNESLRPRA